MALDYSDNAVLLEGLQKNELKAFGYLYRSSRNRLYVLALSIIKNEEAAKDLVQEFFIDLWYHRLFLNVVSSLHSYLYVGVRNRAYKYLEKEKVQNRLKGEFIFQENSDTYYPLENAELKAEIDSAIGNLSPMAAKAFTLHYVENLSHAEIASVLEISRHTVNNHIVRALKELRVKLKRSR